MAAGISFDPLRPLQNQKTFVTGANSGIREACALGLGAAAIFVDGGMTLYPGFATGG